MLHGLNRVKAGLFPALFLAILSSFPGQAQAGEGLFSRAYTTETVPEGHFELEQLVRDRNGRAFGTYNALDFKSEVEYGITDKFQGAFYFDTSYIHAVGAPDDNDPLGETGFTRTSFSVTDFSFEFIYRALSPISDPIGLAFYIEPELVLHDLHNGDREYNGFSNEFRILFQKNFMEDQLILVYNFVAEYEYFRYGDGDTLFLGEFDWNNEIGVTYRVASNWYVGLEARNHNEMGNFYSHDHSVFWAGPAVHYATTHFWATLGLLRQVYGDPSGYDPAGSYMGDDLFLHSHEAWETTLKVGVPL
jgi:hypothetical protein